MSRSTVFPGKWMPAMKTRIAISLLLLVHLAACRQDVLFPETKEVSSPLAEPNPSFFGACLLDGRYVGIKIATWRQSINGLPFGRRDTVQLDFTIACPNFRHGKCEGRVFAVSDTLSFIGDNCGCWCDCLPYVDCGGDHLLGEKNSASMETAC
ncbi:MAG: hypothetical protein D6698_10190 [Gammaproteobacteria bacterium]|nr:MAG: hypothetical protein D6698_10190 [Gammaproteobacteria bacterium]